MGNQGQKWFNFKFSGSACPVDIAVMSVFEKGAVVETDRPTFEDPKGRIKVFLFGEDSSDNKNVVITFKKIPQSPPYHELNLRFPKNALLGRESEDKPFDIRNKDRDYGYCYLRIQPGVYFEGVYMVIDHKIYKVFAKEYSDAIKVFLWENPRDLPDCLKRR
jgi:hypothetical protein